MQVRWTDEAAENLRQIVLYIAQSSPASARRVARIIYRQVNELIAMPHRGRLGPEPGTRELVLTPLRYIVTYEVIGDGVFILRIRHAAQDWPRR
jgi:plasmid stabilization system protein ParE